MNKKHILSIIIVCCFCFNKIHSQSRSVLDASYFVSDHYVAPLKAGKGFHINDLFKQTNFCFTQESADKSNLIQQQTSSKASYKVYFTQTDNEFNQLKSTGISGSINYLNLFSLGASNLEEFTKRTTTQVKRLVFIANVDYGNFEYENDLILTPEAKSYITNKKFDDFVSLYGTHYITGVKKEASIWIIISENTWDINSSNSTTDRIDFGASIPNYGVGGAVTMSDKEQANSFLRSRNLSVTIEVNGPTHLDEPILLSIRNYLNSSESDKYSKIVDLITSTQRQLTDANQSVITQYYFAPFTLKGVQNINWDMKKESQLVEINQNVLRVMLAKKIVDNLVSSGANGVLNVYDSFFQNNDFTNKNQYRNDLLMTYNDILPDLRLQQTELNDLYASLESTYKNCSSIGCSNTVNCCDCASTREGVNFLIPRVETTVNYLNNIFKNAKNIRNYEEELPECKKNNTGYVTIVNKSTNPYHIYVNNNFLMTMDGKATNKIDVPLGTSNIKAEQKSGYMFYATINNRVVNIYNACDEVTITIGYEE